MERAEENNNKRENITNGGANREDQRVKDGIYKNSNDNDHQHRKSKETSSFHHLRNEKIAMILETAIWSSSPSDACVRFPVTGKYVLAISLVHQYFHLLVSENTLS